MQALLRKTAELARAAGRSIASEVATGVLVGVLTFSGGGFLIAAGYGRLSRSIGPDAAAALIGVVLICLAGVILLIRAQQHRAARARIVLIAEIEEARAAPPTADPLQNMVFAAGFELGRLLFARRRR